MSQQGGLTTAGSGVAVVETLTGNSGGAVGPDAAFNINIVGNNTTGINVVGMPGTNTLTIVGIQATTTQRGTVTLATNAETLTGTDTSKVLTPDDLSAKLGAQTLHGLPIGAGSTAALVWTAAPTNGQLLIGNTGNNPVLGNITSTGGTITVTNGPGTINLDLAGGGIAFDQIFVDTSTAPGTNPVVPTGTGQVTFTGGQVGTGVVGTNVIRTASLNGSELTIQIQRSTAVAATDVTKNGVAHFNSAQFSLDANGFVSTSGTGILNTLTGNSGGAISPTAGNINTVGTGSITVAGAGSTLTTQLTGLTNHAVLIGAGTATITNVGPVASTGAFLASNGVGSDPGFSTATYPLTTTVSQILYSSSANTVAGLATANRAVLTTSATGVPVLTPIATDGTFIIGSTAGAPASGTITSTGGTITVTPGSNTINIDLAGGTLGVDSFSPDSGTDPVVPTAAGLVNAKGSGSITTVGSLNTITTQLTGLTNHAILVGAGTTTITKLAVGSTGQVLQGNSAADPSFSTATYPSVATGTGTILRADGTNWVATTATYPTTTTSQQILYSTAANVIGQLTTANSALAATNSSGTLAMRSFSVVYQVFIASGTYTPTSGMLYCIIECVGSGAGGGGAAAAASNYGAGGGGGAGEYACGVFSAATVGASQTVTCGAAGAGGTAGNNAGSNGNTTSVGALITALGGTGGSGAAGSTTTAYISGGAGGTGGTGGSMRFAGQKGGNGISYVTGVLIFGGDGGSSVFGAGGGMPTNNGQTAGTGYGAGGSGAVSFANGNTAGGAGTIGAVRITEYVIA